MKSDNQLAILPVQAWGDSVFNLAALSNGRTAVLFDAGLPGSLPGIRAALTESGLAFEQVAQVLITHHDFDHIGGLPEIVEAAGGKIRVLAHAEEVPFIDGTRPPLKSDPAIRAKMQLSLPAGMTLGPNLPIENPPRVPVDEQLNDGQLIESFGGITVVHIPGHTPGHLAFYLHEFKTLIAGDALNAADGRLMLPAPEHSVDIRLAIDSLGKLDRFEIENVICYHGGCCTDDIRQQIRDLRGRSY